MATAEYDVFLSHAWADGDRPQQIADALTKAGLRVWFDASEINDFASITRASAEGLKKSKALLAHYSRTYPLRRACQWELTAAFLAAQTEGDPRRRVLVINPERGADHIHPIELRDAIFPMPSEDTAALQRLVQSVVKHVSTLDGPLADIHPLIAPKWYGTTLVGSTHFVGRLAEMWQVHSLLHAGDVTQITGAPVASGGIGQVSGLGGVGKSLLAQEYALHFGAAYPGGIFWLRAYGNDDANAGMGPEEREALRIDQVRSIAEELGINTQGLMAAQFEGALARKIASDDKPCLWIVDDVPNGLDGEALRRWFAPHPLVRTLVTTRSREYSSLAQGIDLSVLSPEEAYQLLASRMQPSSDAELEQARELAKDLGYHALALDLAASALQHSAAAAPFADFRVKLTRSDKDALLLAETLANALPNGHEKSIAQTILRSTRGLGAEGLDFLRLASVLAVAPIPAPLVTAIFAEAENLSHEDAEERASLSFMQVTAASLAEVAGENRDARAVHTLVSRTVRLQEKGSPKRTQTLRMCAVKVFGSRIASAADDPRRHQTIELDVAHARQMISIPSTVPEADLLSWIGRYDFERGMYASASSAYERALDFCDRILGPEHPDTLSSMNDLAETLRAQGDLAGARRIQERALEIRHRVLGKDHPDTLASISNLATVLREQGDVETARKLQEETLATSRRVFGLDHPETLAVMGNLASTLSDEGDFLGARTLQEEVLTIFGRTLGHEHPNTLISMNNLATTLWSQGDLSGARKLHEEALANGRRVLGPEHPQTLTMMSNLAVTLAAQGDLAAARRLQEETLSLRRRVLGPQHPDSLVAMRNLARILSEEGEQALAHKLTEDMLAIGGNRADTVPARINAPGSPRNQVYRLLSSRRLRDYVLAGKHEPKAAKPHRFYSCFISYSFSDQDFAERLYAGLRDHGVKCWYAPRDIHGGQKVIEQIDEAINRHDKLLLILSRHSITSEWVKTEIRKARKRERREGRNILFPVRLISWEVLEDWTLWDADAKKDSAAEIREYHIPDFSNWKDPDLYQAEFNRLLGDLKSASATT